MAEHTEELIGLMRKTIEQKDTQIEELRAAIANLNETIEEFRRKFFGAFSERSRKREPDEEAGREAGTGRFHGPQPYPPQTKGKAEGSL